MPRRARRELVDHFGDQLRQVDAANAHRDTTGLDAAQVEQVADQPMQSVALLFDVARDALDGLGRPGGVLARQRRRVALDDRDRRLQLVRDDRHERVLHLFEARLFGEHVGGRAALLQGAGSLAGEDVQHVQVAVREAARVGRGGRRR